MPIGVIEIKTAVAIVFVGLAGPVFARVGPVRQAALADPVERGGVLLRAQHEGIVLG
ncbi:hypothetical protein D9M72_633230 [compost metagenome]